MSERKVLQKYYPPDFDPSALQRRRGPKNSGPRIQQVRIMCPVGLYPQRPIVLQQTLTSLSSLLCAAHAVEPSQIVV
jgi:hypothetical protein